MAAYRFLAGVPDVQDLGGDIVRPAQRVTGQAIESGIVYSLPFAPYPTGDNGEVVWTDALIDEQMALWAGYWNDNAKVPGVAGIGTSQAVDPTGLLKEVAIVVVQSSSGASTTNLTLFPHDFFPDTFPPAVAAARAQLDASEAGGVGAGVPTVAF